MNTDHRTATGHLLRVATAGLLGAMLLLAMSGTLEAQDGGRPLSLPSAIDALINKNLSVMAARYNVDLFRAQRVAAGLKPDLTLVVSATQLTIPRVITHPQYAGFAAPENAVLPTQYSIDVQKLIERGGKRELRVRQADTAITAAEAQLANELREQSYALKQAFLSALLARENFRVRQDNLRHFDRIRQVFAAQVGEGYTSGADLRRIGLEVVDVQGSVSDASLEYAQAVRDVLNLIGEGDRETTSRVATTATAINGPALEVADPPGVVPLDGDLTITPVDLDLDRVRHMALTSRPDIRAAQFELDAADTGVQLAEATRVRDITLGGEYLRSGPDNAVGLAVGVPITTGRRASAALAQATAAKRTAEAHLQQVRTQALTDVEKAFMAYRVSGERLRLFDAQVLRQASEVRDIEQVAYREGERGLLSFLDAQRVYNQTLLSYNQARYDVIKSLYQLEWAAGTADIRAPGVTVNAAVTGAP